MKNILLTGSTGFVGHNILPLLSEVYNVAAPVRSELDLLDANRVRRYLDSGKFDAVIHLANPTGHNPADSRSELFEISLKVFSSLEHCAGLYGKMIYLGTGAEYGKHRSISMIREEAFGEELPRDSYGLSRYLMGKLAEKHENIINLRLFACCGPSDSPDRLIPYVTRCVRAGEAIELRQDVWFDYLYVDDIFPVLAHFIESSAKFKAYNLCSGKRVRISAIAEEVKRQMGSKASVVFREEGLNLEYTASNSRLRAELHNWEPRSIGEGIREILKKGF